MTTTILTSNNKVTIILDGHLDTQTSTETSSKINRELDNIGTIDSVTIDASHLDYISSSGLRILLSMAKRYKDFRITDVTPRVYEVFETTGFTKIMTVERALRRLSIKGCKLIGIGGVGRVYRLDGDTIIKVFREGTTMNEVRREIMQSKEAFVLGMPTAISFDIVKVEPSSENPTECYGLTYELLKAQTLSTYVKLHPEQLDDCARKYASLFQQMHQIEVPTGSNIPSAIEHEREQIKHTSRYFPDENINMMLNIINSIPKENRLLHLDLQTKNAMIQDGELMLIDMGEVGYGHPVLDLGHAYSAMISLAGADYETIIGMPQELGQQLWNRAMDYYFAGLPADMIAERKKQIEVISCVRNFSWLSLSDSFPEEVVNACKALFDERISKRYDYIMDVCKTLNNWKL